MEGVFQVVLILALHWQLQVVNAQDANTQCEKSFNTNYGQVSNQDFANATCSQMKIRVSGMEPILLLCPFFMLKVGEQEYCMTVSWTDRDRNITTLVAQNTKKKKKKKKQKKKNQTNTNASKKKKNRRIGKENPMKDKNTGSRKMKGRHNRNKASKNGKRRKRNAKKKASKKKQKKRANPWEENIRLPRALKKQGMIGTLQRVNKTRKRPSTKTVRHNTTARHNTKTFKKSMKEDYARFEMKSFVASYCGTDIPYGLNAIDGIVNIDIVPSSNTFINRQEVITDNEGSGGGETSDDNIVTSSLGTQGTVPQQILEAGRGIHQDIVFQCFWSPSAP